jgi:phosphatidylglycerol:prolipoprotein diacylglycerol transferase
VHPRLIEIGNFSLPTYGLLVASGLILGLLVTVNLAKRQGIDEDRIWNMGLVAILAGIIGSKLLYLLTTWQEHPDQQLRIFSLDTLQSGGVFSGGLLLSIVVCYWYAVRHHMPKLKTADSFAPGIALGHAVGRLGCFAAGCCYGKPTTLPWGVTFTNRIAGELVGTPLNVRLHPTQIYEFVAEGLIFVLLLRLFRHRRFPGEISAAYLFLYGVARYFLEFLRGDPDRGAMFGGVMSVTQFIALLLVIGGGILWMLSPRPHAGAQLATTA